MKELYKQGSEGIGSEPAPDVHGDSRCYFMETYPQRDMEKAGPHYIFVQDNQSAST